MKCFEWSERKASSTMLRYSRSLNRSKAIPTRSDDGVSNCRASENKNLPWKEPNGVRAQLTMYTSWRALLPKLLCQILDANAIMTSSSTWYVGDTFSNARLTSVLTVSLLLSCVGALRLLLGGAHLWPQRQRLRCCCSFAKSLVWLTLFKLGCLLPPLSLSATPPPPPGYAAARSGLFFFLSAFFCAVHARTQ